METIGIDPGAKFVGVSVRDGNTLMHSSTYVRPADVDPITWARTVTQRIKKEVTDLYPHALIGIESVTKPNPYHQGKINMMNPEYIINLALVVGALANQYPEAVIIRPGKNGSQPAESYPKELNGRRPKTLPGINEKAGTRNHEKSAWDVAGEVQINSRNFKK